MTRSLADLALRRPWALLSSVLVVLALTLAADVGAPGRIGVGSLRLAGPEQGPDLALVTRGDVPASSRVYRVALSVIASQVGTDPGVRDVRQGAISRDGRSTVLEVALRPSDPGERQDAVERIRDEIDPGPLRVSLAGAVPATIQARRHLGDQLWKLGLLALPFALLAVAATLGPGLGLSAVLCAATATAGTLAGLRLAGGLAGVSLVGIAPGAAVGLVLGIELVGVMGARFHDEVQLANREEALRRTTSHGARVAVLALAATLAATVGILATPLDAAGSIVLACGIAAALAGGSALLVVPAMLALAGRERNSPPSLSESWSSRLPRSSTAWTAASPARTAAVAAAVVAVLLAFAAPMLGGETRPFSARDLPAGEAAREALAVIDEPMHSGRQSLLPKLPLAAGVSLLALTLVMLAVFRSPRPLLAAPAAMLPAAAAGGLAVFVFAEGHLADALGQSAQRYVETGALACILVTLVVIGAVRAMLAAATVRSEHALGVGTVRSAGQSAAFTVPGATAATLAAGLAASLLAGADLYPAREFGLAVAAGLVLDLMLIRAPVVAALARWGS